MIKRMNRLIGGPWDGGEVEPTEGSEDHILIYIGPETTRLAGYVKNEAGDYTFTRTYGDDEFQKMEAK